MKIDFTKFAEQNMLTYNDSKTFVFVKPTSRHDFISYPLEDLSGTVALTIEEYLGLRTNYYQFNEQLTGIEEYVAEEVEDEPVKEEVVPAPAPVEEVAPEIVEQPVITEAPVQEPVEALYIPTF